ncbi:MAG TPA: M15 family metallopeptidase [Candidatus Saccharimonadales bacterium]
MAFTKQYITTFDELAIVPPDERYRFYLQRNLLATEQGFSAQQEPVVRQAEIERAGIMCRPFWNDENDGNELDSEGQAFEAYRQTHPTFDLIIRTGALKRLAAAQKALPKHLRLVLKASFRPLEVQQTVFDAELANTKQKHPEWDDETAYKHTLEYVTDPSVNLPPHASGGTVDLTLWDETTNTYVDVGSPINAVDDSSWGDNHDGLTKSQIAMRDMLRSTMLAAGFAPLASEWWHYSYGDQRWAVYYDKPEALYGAVTEETPGYEATTR